MGCIEPESIELGASLEPQNIEQGTPNFEVMVLPHQSDCERCYAQLR